MTQIDTSKWGKFRVGDLFTIYLGDYNNPKFLTEDENGIPLVSATTTNNGISGYYKKTPNLKVITKNKITWGKQCPYFCYQTTDFITGQGTYYLDVSALSFYTNLFICSVLNNEISQKYGYNNCLIGKKLSEEIILLPITAEGSPDWQFMEDYMKEITKLAAKRVEKLKEEKPQTKIDTSNWKKFKVGELFDVANGKKYPSSIRQTGELPLISTTANNNGISDYIKDRNDGVYSNCITVAYSGSVGATFYHKEKVFVGETVIALLPKFKMNQYSGLFICSILSKINSKFSYTQKIKVLQYKNEAISLPVTPEGTPDFDYMENYIKNLTEKAKKKFSDIPQ